MSVFDRPLTLTCRPMEFVLFYPHGIHLQPIVWLHVQQINTASSAIVN